jgi:hypothetical protein
MSTQQSGIVPTKQAQGEPLATNPFANGLPDHVNAGNAVIESSRAIAEAQGMLLIAKRFPRSEAHAYDRIMQACKRRSLAERATYSYPRGGKAVSGPTIRLAEVLAREWGNMEYGIRELSQRDGESEMEAFAWDTQKNLKVSRRFVVKHERLVDKRLTKLDDPRDIYERVANDGARRLRACILEVIPGDLVDDALAECRRTLRGDNSEPISEKTKKLVRAFGKFGVQASHLEQWLGKPLEQILDDEYLELGDIFNSLRDGESTASQWFDVPRHNAATEEAANLTEQVMNGANNPTNTGPEWPADNPPPGNSLPGM